jgi:hypothetical protein
MPDLETIDDSNTRLSSLEEGQERNGSFEEALASTEAAGSSQLVCTWPGCHMEKFSRPCELKYVHIMEKAQ